MGFASYSKYVLFQTHETGYFYNGYTRSVWVEENVFYDVLKKISSGFVGNWTGRFRKRNDNTSYETVTKQACKIKSNGGKKSQFPSPVRPIELLFSHPFGAWQKSLISYLYVQPRSKTMPIFHFGCGSSRPVPYLLKLHRRLFACIFIRHSWN